jgi:hypothetical protein
MAINNFPRTPGLVSEYKTAEQFPGLQIQPAKADYDFWIDGYAVTPQLHQFCMAYRKASPHVKFLACSHNTAKAVYSPDENNPDGTRLRLGHVYTSVFVYADSSEYVMGRISHNAEEGGFGVESHKIANKQYSAGNSGYYRMWSTDTKRAVKNANKFIGPWALDLIARIDIGSFAGHARRPAVAARDKLTEIAAIDSVALAREIAYLNRQGVQFQSAEIQVYANNVQTFIDEYDAQKKYKGDAVFVSIRTINNGKSQVADIGHANVYEFRRSTMTFETKRVEDLDADFAGKLAALTMVEPRKYVEGIGYRATEQSFWVEVRDV